MANVRPAETRLKKMNQRKGNLAQALADALKAQELGVDSSTYIEQLKGLVEK